MSDAFPAAISRWQFVGGRWFSTGRDSGTAPRYFYTIATKFKLGDKMIDAGSDGLTSDEFLALRNKFPDAVRVLPPDQTTPPGVEVFALQLVPEGSVVDITPD